ncbi:MAG: MFS transporter [Candidatus Eisenbacteria bacterium]|uniref:MFS transporter n=1 Tax=Eiseniibacteriota bacterium TaxID=2212470 RepID=A0A9D6L7B5_UNCEI|nr:MFS transporter [Candidatus Eisenbacteria bacterium]MBI3539956.1 MFS transporter [Candidatus Eisenbacteria bacterium]
MSPLAAAWTDYRDAVARFSRPARLYLLTELLAWTCHGIFAVVFNLYLLDGGWRESLIGRAISINGLGMALAALPAGLIADRWGRRRCLILGAIIDAVGQMTRASSFAPAAVFAGSLCAGAGQSLLATAGAPFLTEHSTPRERTHLFSTFFATALVAGVIGSALGGEIPVLLGAVPGALHPDRLHAYRGALWIAALLNASALLPLLRMGRLVEPSLADTRGATDPIERRRLIPIGVNACLIGAGAGLVIPFMNLYFARRFACSSSQIGAFFSIAAVFTAIAALIGPVLARRFGKLRTAVASQLLSLPFLVTLGLERRLDVAVVAFWMRATLMQASTPLVQAFVMEALPVSLRARATSLINMVWNIGWAVSATLAGLIIQRFGYDVPFFFTAGLYATAAITFYLSFRNVAETGPATEVPEEAMGTRGEGAVTE